MAEPVLAAGAVLWRGAVPLPTPGPPAGTEDPSNEREGIEVCVVHRPSYDDWSLPKGKLKGDEHPLVGAAREVLEETGFRGLPQLRLPPVSYVLPDGRAKTVDFWLMRVSDDPVAEIADPTEVDAIDWLTPAAALARLSYPADCELVADVARRPPVTAITPLVRHARAGDRASWVGDDAGRPIDAQGRIEAEGLAEVLVLFEPERLIAAPPLRCRQTLEPLAERLGLPIDTDPAFAEPDQPDEVPARTKVAANRLAELRAGPTAVICSQGKVIPPLLALLRGTDDPAPHRTPKGGGWLLSWSGDRLTGLTRL